MGGQLVLTPVLSPPPPSPPIQIWPPNRTQRLNVAAPAECLNWKLPANRSFPSVVYLTEKQRGGRMNSELRFYFTSVVLICVKYLPKYFDKRTISGRLTTIPSMIHWTLGYQTTAEPRRISPVSSRSPTKVTSPSLLTEFD